MDHQIYNLLDEIEAMIRRWQAQAAYRNPEPLTRAKIEELRSRLGLLEYLVTPKLTGKTRPGPVIGNPICSEPGCKADWQTGLLNHANAGFDPVWYCREHIKQLEHSHHVPGLEHPTGPQIQRAQDLSREAGWFLRQMGPEAPPEISLEEPLGDQL